MIHDEKIIPIFGRPSFLGNKRKPEGSGVRGNVHERLGLERLHAGIPDIRIFVEYIIVNILAVTYWPAVILYPGPNGGVAFLYYVYLVRRDLVAQCVTSHFGREYFAAHGIYGHESSVS